MQYDGKMTDPNWKGFVQKKAFKTLTKNSWKKRFLLFDAELFALKWADTEAKAATPKGTFNLDPNDLTATICEDHKKPFEIKIASKAQTLFMCCESSDAQNALLARIDAARRLKVASVEHGAAGTLLYKSESEVNAAGNGVFPGEPGKKVFTWGVGMLLGVGKADISGMAVPQRVATFRASPAVTSVSAGPEHAAAVTDDSATQLWGSNEFYQLAQSQETPSCVRPVPVVSLSARKVLSLACGGSHSLAIIGDGVNSGAGALFAWGTGTVGQLGLGNTTQILDGPAQVNTPPGPDGKPSLVTSIFAGLVSSAAISAAGDCYVWGDASAGRLGLPGIPDMTPPDAVPQFVNAAVVWTPTILRVQPGDVGMTAAQGTPRVVSVALGGSFSLFSVWTGSGPGNVLLVSGALGWDITRDTYGYPPKDERELNGMIDDEVKAVPRRPTPMPTAPFGTQPTIMAAFAGARHAAVVVSDPMRGGAPRLYTAGKGWLGHGSGPDSVLLERPTVSPGFVAVGGALAEEDVVEAGCGHSHTLARTSDGRLFAWGRGDSGELGHGNLSDRALPVPCRPVDGHHYTSVAAGSYYSVAVADAGFQSKPSPQQVVDGFKSKWSTIAAAQEEASKPPPAPAPAPVAVAASPAAAAAKPAAAAAAGGAKADPAAAKKKKEAEAQEKARAALEEGELPPDWSWEQTDDGEVYYIKPDGDTQWEDPRDDWDSYWPGFVGK